MAKYLIVFFAVLSGFLLSCNNEKKEQTSGPAQAVVDSAALKNLEAAHQVNRAFETGDFTQLKSFIAPDGVDHAGPNGDVRGVDSIIATLQQFAKMTTDMKATTIKELADKDYVFQWMKMSGKMRVDAYGMKAGTEYATDAIEVTRFNSDHQAAEHWEFMTLAEMMKMMGGNK